MGPALEGGTSKFLVATDCPYFDRGHQLCLVQRDVTGRVIGVSGPHEELYFRSEVGELEPSQTDSDETDAERVVVETASTNVNTLSDAMLEPGQVGSQVEPP